MFTDHVTIDFTAGNGGNGAIAWRREKFVRKGGPCGGNGGKGGSIILRASNHMFALDHLRNRRKIAADNGGQGQSNNRQGKSGKDLVILVPCGTEVKDPATGHLIEDLIEHDQEITLCRGGRGGKGNTFFKTPTNQAPNKSTPGLQGEEQSVTLELKMIADVGFVGKPNAGKSTLMSNLTAHDVKIGEYPFTTLKPNLSYIEFDDFSRIYLADIPGIIQDAHKNRGLGFEFLKHIMRSEVLILLVDITADDPFSDYQMLLHELQEYDQDLIRKPRLLALNKMDQEVPTEKLAPFKGEKTLEISALTGKGIPELIAIMRALAQAKSIRYT